MKTKSEKILFGELILLSFAGIILFVVQNTMVTPWLFYTVYFAIKIIRSKVTYKNTGLFVSIVFVLSAGILANMGRISLGSIAHLAFYLVMMLLLLNSMASIIKNQKYIEKLCRVIIICYFINILISYLLSWVGYEGILQVVFRYSTVRTGEIRYAAFASEASYLAFTLTYCVFPLMIIDRNKNLKFIIIAIITIILAKTSYGFICIGFVGVLYFKNNTKYIITGLAILFILTLMPFQNKYLDRVHSVMGALHEDNVEAIAYGIADADGSAGVRVLPSFLYFVEGRFLEPGIILGHGSGSSSEYFKGLEDFGKQEDEFLGLGFFPGFVYEAGIVATILILIYIRKFTPKVKWYYWLFFLFGLFNFSFSTEMFQFSVCGLMLNHLVFKYQSEDKLNRILET